MRLRRQVVVKLSQRKMHENTLPGAPKKTRGQPSKLQEDLPLSPDNVCETGLA